MVMSLASASSSMKAEKRICNPAVPFNEATFPARVLMLYVELFCATTVQEKARAITTTKTTIGRLVIGTPFLSGGSLRRLRYRRRITLFCVRSRRGRPNSEGKHPDGHSVRSADESAQSEVSYDRLTVSSRPLDETCMIAQILPVHPQPWSRAKSANCLEGGQE